VQAALELAEEPASPDGWELTLWMALGTGVYFALGVLGRETIAAGETKSLVWPAAGAAMLFYGLSPLRWWPLVTVLVGLATVLLNTITGATLTQAGIFVVANVAQATCGALLLRGLSPHLRGAGGDQPFDRLRDFWSILAASVVSALVGAGIGWLGRGLVLDEWSGDDVVVWWGRNTAGCLVVVTTALLCLASYERLRRPGARARLRSAVRDRAVEALLLMAFTAVLYVAVFLWYPSLPVAFPLLVPTVWVGLRFEALAATLHSLAVCTLVVLFTLLDHGAFASVGPWNEVVLVSQVFIALVFGLGVMLSLGRSEVLTLTDTVTTTRAVSESQADVLSAIIDTMHDGLTVIDANGQVLRRNPAGAQMVRTDPDALNNLRDSKFTMMTGEGRVLRAADYPWVRAIKGENVVDQDIVLVFDDGSPSRTLAVSARRLPSHDPAEPAQAVVIYHDVTADRAQRTALESFAGVVAHDLRGPLAVIEGWTEMICLDLEASGSLAREEVAPKLERISAAAAGMQRLIGDLLDSSISREQQLRTAVVDLESLARSVAEQRAAMSTESPPTIEVDWLPDVHADAGLVRQLLDNLIGNAVKYVAPGAVPRVWVTGREVGDRVEVTVADEGIGIPASERDQIFEAFHRAHGAQGYDGHGIGLAVCKKIVERHGGQISARAPIGRTGTRIVFTLPAVRAGMGADGTRKNPPGT
jgi:signal transduction histidine kinase